MLQFGNPLVAGTTLVRSAIQSTNYIPGSAGWAVKNNGFAEFTGLAINGGTFTGVNWIQNSAGSFCYSGTPAAGNLIVSSAPARGTDGFGNAYLAGETTYQQGTSPCIAISMTPTGSLNFYTAATFAGPWSQTAGIGFNGSNLLTIDPGIPTGGVFFTEGNILSSGGSLAHPTIITTDAWNAAAPASGWVATQTCLYSLMNEQTVQVTGQFTIPAGAANPSTVTTLPTGYLPGRQEMLLAFENGAAPFTAIPHVCVINTSGTIQVFGALTSGNALRVFGRYPLAT